MSQTTFTERYRKWCKRHDYRFHAEKTVQIHAESKDLIAILPKDSLTKTLIKQTVNQFNTASKAVRSQMQRLPEQLPEYSVVMGMYGVGKSSKRDAPELRKTLFLVMDTLIKKVSPEDTVFRFTDKKCAEGKPYLVYRTTNTNKFLRVYYGKVKEYLAQRDTIKLVYRFIPSQHVL